MKRKIREGLVNYVDINAIIYYMNEAKIPGYKQNPPDWCDDCKSAGGEECPDCGCTHNC